jgi:hypothetical protein
VQSERRPFWATFKRLPRTFEAAVSIALSRDRFQEQQMPEHALYLSKFVFPGTLPNRRANFRFVIDVRYQDEKGNFKTENVVMPGLDTWWECDKGKSSKPNYVRHRTESRFDMRLVDDWDALVLRFKAETPYMMRVKIFDVDRPDFWEKMTRALGTVVAAALGRGQTALENVPVTGDALGSVVDEIKSSVSRRLANGDKVLFKGSALIEDDVIEIEGKGSTDGDSAGIYKLAFRHETSLE